MANLREIRNRINSIQSTQQITKAMKMVAAAKLRKAQMRMTNNRPYATKLKEIISRVATDSDAMGNPLFSVKEGADKKALYIVVASDRGLCGGFNNNLFKAIEANISESDYDASQIDVIAIGRKTSEYFTKRSYNLIDKNDGFFDKLEYALISPIVSSAIQKFLDGTYSSVQICYNEFKSVIAQERKVVQLLPIEAVESEGDEHLDIDYIFEADKTSILHSILPQHLNIQLWTAVLESNAAEQGARMSAMDSATENAKDLEKDLRLKYNRARQDSITTELTEIVSGASALENA